MCAEHHAIYSYISSKAAYDPARTIYVCAPEKDARDYAAAERFAAASGWRQIAEEDGAVLVLPLAPRGWRAEGTALLPEIYTQTKGGFASRSGKSLFGRSGYLWCWETLICLVGYEEGAVFAGNTLAAFPSRFAAAALVNGVPDSYAAGEAPTDHWMVPRVSADYSLQNREVPVCLWLLLREAELGREAADYFSRCNGAEGGPVSATFGEIPALLYANAREPVQQVRLSAGDFGPQPELSRTIFHQHLEKAIRWKCGPDGKLAAFMSRADFNASPRFVRDHMAWGGHDYGYFLHLPAGMSREEARGLPLVFSVHGRGEPAWMFAEKNGWDTLADETWEFVLAVPDSPENIWFLDRDGGAFPAMIDRIARDYGIDRERVYLTGFSNGAMLTRQVGTVYPQLFAALSPWNGPDLSFDGSWGDEVLDRFEREGWEMPYFVCQGDQDPAAPPGSDRLLERMRRVNGCGGPELTYTGANHYTPRQGYREGERMTAAVYPDRAGVPRAAVLTMKNMPHGAVHDESRAVWELMRRYRRPAGSRKIAYTAHAAYQREQGGAL